MWAGFEQRKSEMAQKQRKRGFSLVEVMLALVLVSFSLMLVLGTFPTVLANLDHLDVSERMYLTTQQTLNQIINNRTFVSTTAFEITPAPPQMPTDSKGTPKGKIICKGETPLPVGDPRYQLVYVEITWKRGAVNTSFRLSGYITP
jgi:prepilin-type N-terminal cleavage/methylation domain-containing protein